MESDQARRELSTWKDIGAYLGVTDRAAQIWERQRAMPVHRLPGPGRGRVLAYTDELDAWKRAGETSEEISAPEPEPAKPGHVRWIIWGIVVLAALLGVSMAMRNKPVPFSATLEGDTLLVKDQKGRELWRRVFPEMSRTERYKYAILADLDSDDTPEVLVAYRRPVGDELICFNGRGDTIWKYKPGRPIRSQRRSYDGAYGIQGFAVGRTGSDGRTRIVVDGFHMTYSPAQVALLDENGKLLREYWHPGHLNEVSIGDTDGDGRNELYFGGVNNVKGAATLVVLDPDRFQGSAADDAGHAYFPDLPVSHEMGRVLLPRTRMNRACFPYNVPTALDVTGKTIRMGVSENPIIHFGAPVIVYSLRPNLSILDVTLSDAFRSSNRNPCGLAVVPPPPDQENLDELVTLTPRAFERAETKR